MNRPKPRPTANEQWAQWIVSTVESAPWAKWIAARLTRVFKKAVPGGPIKDVLSGSALGHPMHPLLTDVTIGAWTSAWLLDLLPSKAAHEAADHLIGIGVVSAVPTAITGLSDLADTGGPARALGGAHALGNSSATALYAAAYIARRSGRRGIGLALSWAGATAATAAAFFGGHLAYRKGVGVDTTIFEERIEDWTRAAAETEVSEGKPTHARVHGNDVLLYRANGSVVAYSDRCTHRGGPLHKGTLEDGCITCPWHGSTFRLQDGALMAGPAVAPQPAYDVRVRDGSIEIRSR